MNDSFQDDGLVKADIANHERLKSARAPWESTWRDIDDRYPDGAGGFNAMTAGGIRGERNFDITHIEALGRFAAAGVAITTPEEQHYIRPRFSAELMKNRNVKLWCDMAGERIYQMRHATYTMFGVAANEDWDQLGRYGTSVLWVDARADTGLFYRTLHLSECYIDVDFAGLVDTLHRKFEKTAAQLAQQFGYDNLTPKMRKAIDDGKEHTTKFELLHIVAPNTEHDAERLDWRRMPIASRYLALDEKIYLKRAGFHSAPMAASRHTTSPMEIYGRSPAIKTLPTVGGVNAMRHTVLRAGHKMVDPAMVFNNDDGISSIATKPGGMTAGLVDEQGRLLIHRLPGGEQGIPYAMEMIEQERQVIKTAFLEEFYKILTDPNSRMTTVEVLEVMAKQGVLVRPFASRYRTEKQGPTCSRELDLALRAGQIDPFPPEVVEAGEWPLIDYENPLAAMARAESTAKTMRFIEALAPMAQVDEGAIYDYLDTDELVPGIAEEIGVKARYVRDPKAVADIRKAREDSKQMAAGVDQLAGAAGAYLDIAKGNQIAEGM